MISKNIAIFEPSAIKLSSTPTSLNEPFFIEISQPLHVMLNSLTRIQEATMKSLSTASWMEVQPKFTNPAAISKMTAASANKPLVFEKKVNNKRQSNEEYFQHLAEEILSKVLQLEPKLGRTLTMFDLYNHFTKEELSLVWDAVFVYYPNIRNFPDDMVELEEEVLA